MTGINLTLIVEIIIFIIFFFIIDRLIWQPFLKNIFERERSFLKKEKEVEDIRNKANELNKDYIRTLKEKESNAKTEVDTITKKAYAQQREMIEREQMHSRKELAEYKESLRKIYCVQTADILPHIESIVDEMFNVIIQRKRLL
ncbi:MAG: hypothetical protein N3G21_10010 [Candidatus Hydrogenedentes bacterium]|nr:hypothetical protein [Candidatus Hydrogenedentota bacterium]